MAQPSVYVRQKIDGRWKHVKVDEGRGKKTGDLKPPFFVRPFIKGKQTWRSLDAQTFKAAKEEAADINNPAIAAPKDRTLIESAVELYLDQKKNKSKKTGLQYQTALRGFIASLNGTKYGRPHKPEGT
jgi:hypothetical protein